MFCMGDQLELVFIRLTGQLVYCEAKSLLGQVLLQSSLCWLGAHNIAFVCL